MSEDEQLALLASDGMLVKRPLLVTEEKAIPGFREAEWQEALQRGALSRARPAGGSACGTPWG